MAGQIECGGCHAQIPDDSALPDDRRTPCPHCQSKARIHSAHVTTAVGTSVSILWNVISYTDKLFDTARRLFHEGEYGIAVVVAHMACEVAVERALTKEFAARGLEYLEDAVTGMMSGYNLGNDRHCKL